MRVRNALRLELLVSPPPHPTPTPTRSAAAGLPPTKPLLRAPFAPSPMQASPEAGFRAVACSLLHRICHSNWCFRGCRHGTPGGTVFAGVACKQSTRHRQAGPQPHCRGCGSSTWPGGPTTNLVWTAGTAAGQRYMLLLWWCRAKQQHATDPLVAPRPEQVGGVTPPSGK